MVHYLDPVLARGRLNAYLDALDELSSELCSDSRMAARLLVCALPASPRLHRCAPTIAHGDRVLGIRALLRSQLLQRPLLFA